MVKQIYSTQKGMFERESMGLNTEDSEVVFPAQAVSRFLQRRFPVHPETRVLLVALDPSGGGSSSMSLLTTCIYQSRITVVAFDEAPISGVAEMEIMIMRHVTAVRAAYPNHWLIFALESNLGQEAAHAQAMLQRHRVARHYCIREKHRIGVLTTAARKALYADNLRFYLEQDAIGLREPCVLTGNPAAGEVDRVQQVLHEQLSNYRRVTVEAAPGRLAKRHFSGKISGSRQGKLCVCECIGPILVRFSSDSRPCTHPFQDDLVLTLQLSCYWLVRFSSRSIPNVQYTQFDV